MTEKAQISLEEALEKLKEDEIDFEALMDPYREGGIMDNPVRRTWGSMIRWLVDKYKFDVDIVGAAILLVCFELKKGKKFEGTGHYGSSGHALAQYIKQTCAAIRQNRMENQVFSIMGKKLFSQIEPMIAEKIRKSITPWYNRLLGKV